MIKLLLLLQLISSVFGHGRLITPMTRVGHTHYENDPIPLSSPEWICRHETPRAPTSAVAGETLDIQWNLSVNHVGDCEIYMSYDYNAPREEMRWFKIANYPDCRKNNQQTMPLELPAWLKNGRAVLRWSWYALHLHHGNLVEFFDQCSDIEITNGASELPTNLVTYPLFGLHPEHPSDAPGYRDPFGNDPMEYLTGPACAQGMTSNGCPLTAPGTKGHLSVTHSNSPTFDPIDDTTTTTTDSVEEDDVTTTTTEQETELEPVEGCFSGRFVSKQSHVNDQWCQDTCTWNMDFCDPYICECKENDTNAPTGSPTSVLSEFHVIEGHGMDGGDLTPNGFKGSLEECAAECLNRPECVGFDIGRGSNHCGASWCATDTCFLKTTGYTNLGSNYFNSWKKISTTTTLSPTLSPSDSPTGSPTAGTLVLSEFHVIEGHGMDGGDLTPNGFKGSLEECAEECLNRPECVGFDIGRGSNHCGASWCATDTCFLKTTGYTNLGSNYFNSWKKISTTTTHSPTLSPSVTTTEAPPLDEECEQQLDQCQDVLDKISEEFLEKTQPFSNYVLTQPLDSFTEDSWLFEEVESKVSSSLPQGFKLVLSDFDGFQQYALKEVSTQKLYSTCVFYSPDAQETCPENAQCGATTENGWPNAVAKKLKEAFRRNNFRHEYCASLQESCDFWGLWWKDTFVEKMDYSRNLISEEDLIEMSHNICVSADNELLYVTKDELKRTCVGWGDSKEQCDSNRTFICTGFSLGHQSYGHPGQIIQALGVALNNGENGVTDYYHPQCGALQNRPFH